MVESPCRTECSSAVCQFPFMTRCITEILRLWLAFANGTYRELVSTAGAGFGQSPVHREPPPLPPASRPSGSFAARAELRDNSFHPPGQSSVLPAAFLAASDPLSELISSPASI